VPGGAEYQAYLICRELAKRGHETHYIAHQSEETDISTDEGIVVHRLSQNDDTNVLESLEKIGADVYYFRIAHDLPLLWRAKRRIDAKFVYNVSRDIQCRSMFAPGPTQNSENMLLNRLSLTRYAVYRFLLRTPDEIFVQSHQQQTLLEKNQSLQSTVIGNGHPIPSADFEKESPPVVLWLASLKQVKNPETFIRLVELTSDLPCQFWIVGRPVDDTIHEMVREKAAEHETLEYLGGCGILESNEYFKKAAVYVHTGDAEGFPNTFIQSWLHRTPVLSFCTDPDSALAKNSIGAHCESLNEAESVLRELIEKEEYRTQMGKAARSYGRKNHSIGVIVDKLERKLRSLITESSKPDSP
jgi:glycosyltransferase involved in cell wall biosynthesis